MLPISMCLPAHPKTRGEIAEALFIARATALGFTVSKPFGENAPYDFILDYRPDCHNSAVPQFRSSAIRRGRRPLLLRVQVKSAWTKKKGRYQIGSGCGPKLKRPYNSNDIDFLIAYLAPDCSRGSDRPRSERRRKAPQPGCRLPTANRRFCSNHGDIGDAFNSAIPQFGNSAMLGSWFIIPVEALTCARSLYLSHTPWKSRYAPFKENWDLLRRPR